MLQENFIKGILISFHDFSSGISPKAGMDKSVLRYDDPVPNAAW